MALRVGTWWSNTWWGKRTDAINITLVIAILTFCMYKAYFP